MQIDLKLFLASLGSRLDGDLDETGRIKPLECRCPIHSDGSPMRISQLPDGSYLFKCTDGSCMFFGDAISLVAAKYGISVQTAIGMLRPGGVLAGCLTSPLLAVEAEAYLERASTQLKIKAYLSKCRDALSRNPGKARVRTGIDITSEHLLPKGIGLLEVGDGLPEVFFEYRKPKYRKTTIVVFPYTYNGDVMHVKLYDASTRSEIDDVSIVRPDLGVFCEDSLAEPSNGPVHVVSDPMAASVYYSVLKQSSVSSPRVVSVSGFPLPSTFSGAKNVNFIGFDDARIPLDILLDSLGSNDIVEGCDRQPSFRYTVRACHSLDVRVNVYDKIEENDDDGNNGNADALKLVAKRLAELVSVGKHDQALESLRRHQLTDENRTKLLEQIAANDLGASVRELVATTEARGLKKLVLANRNVLVSEPTGLFVERTDRRIDSLANFGIRVLHRTIGFDGTEALTCSVTPDDKTVPPAEISIPEDAWSSPAKIRRIVARTFSSRGSSPYIAVYSPPGIDWCDVLSKLAEGCCVRREVTRLGVDETRDIQFPEATVETRLRDVVQQSCVVNIPPHVAARYSGITVKPGADWRSRIRQIIEHETSLDAASVLAGLGYVTYRTACLTKRGKPPSHGGRHLFFVETEPGCFDTAITVLNRIFTDEPVVEVSPGAPVKSLSKYRQLGTLPLICRIPRVDNIQRLLSVLDDIDFPVMAVVDSYTASLINGRIRAEYVTPSNERTDRYEFSQNTVHALRDGLPDMLLCAGVPTVLDDADARSTSSVLGYRILCNLSDSADSGSVKAITSLVFAGAGMSGVDSFFDRLHYGMTGLSNKFRLCVVHGQPQNGYSFTGRGQHMFVMDGTVLIGKYVVDLVNKFSSNVFSVQQLDTELREREFIVAPPQDLDIDMSRCWCIPREVYEDRILGRPINLDRITQ